MMELVGDVGGLVFVIKFLQEGVVDDDVIVSVSSFCCRGKTLSLFLFFCLHHLLTIFRRHGNYHRDGRQLRQQRSSSCQRLSSSRVIMETMTRLFFSEVVTREETREG